MGTQPDRRPGGEQQNQSRAQDRLSRAVPHRLGRAVFVAGEHRGHLRPFRRYGRQLEIGVHAVFGGPGGWCRKRAAPMATVVLGSASIAGARPNSAEISWETIGIRDEPPASRIASSCVPSMAADSSARCSVSMVRSRSGRIISSNSARVSRTRCRTPPSATGMVVSVSTDRASFASVHSRRSRATSGTMFGSFGSIWVSGTPAAAHTCSNSISSKVTPPSLSIPSGLPRTVNAVGESFRTTAASKVPPPRSYTARWAPTSTRSRLA